MYNINATIVYIAVYILSNKKRHYMLDLVNRGDGT